ncbi:ABC transporter permease [Halomicrobium urmianum]|uniref:ABC transporter permease n=1 Tax=Halomicrobium urmianum TaxID=1586233 RepID=UPI001CD92BC5|nr:ABC transporter permease [Halomicrobium urmianum]
MLPTRSRETGGRDRLSIALLPGAVLLAYYLVPLAALVTARSPAAVLASLQSPDVIDAALTSVLSAAVSTGVAVAFGLPLAYWLARSEGPLAGLVTAVAVLPLVLPPVVSGMVLLTVVGPGTLLGSVGAGLGVPLTRSFPAVVLAQTFVASPFVVVTAKTAFEDVDARLEEVARTLGEDRLSTVRRVTLPLVRPSVLAGTTLAFARAIGEFGATLMLAYYPRTMPVQIWVAFTTRGLDAAFPVAVVLLGVALATIAVVQALDSNPLS